MLSITEFPRRFAAVHKRALSRAMTSMRATRSPQRVVAPPLQALAQDSMLGKGRTMASLTKLATPPPPMSNPHLHLQRAAFSVPTHLVDDSDEHDARLLGERGDDWFTTAQDPRTTPTFPGRDPQTGRLSSIAMPNLKTCTRQEILDYFDNSWALTDAIFATLQGERAFLTPPPHQLRHPLIFYYGHPTVFYLNKCIVAGLLRDKVNPYFEHIFEVGVDEMRWDDMSKNEMQWPHVADVTAYRRQVYGIIRNLIETHPGLDAGHAQIDENHALWGLCMALEHERIHLETTSVLIQEHPIEFFRPSTLLADMHESARRSDVARRPSAGKDYPVNAFLPVEGGTVKIGKPRDFPSFGWDNEYGTKDIEVPSCQATKYLISNGEFSEFVRSGGYLAQKYWSPTGWSWRCFRNTKWPQFWVPDGPSGSHQYRLRTMFEIIDMQWDWPAQVNYHEAQAFCKWKNEQDGNSKSVNYHIVTEPIHQLLRDEVDRSSNIAHDDILRVRERKMADDRRKNLNFSYASFSPVDAMQPTASGFHDVFGNAWEWCEDMFSALPGFALHPYYDDFSAPCFDGEHQVIMGGSYISTGDNGASKFARYHFRPHFFQHAGFRVVAQPVDPTTQSIRLATTDVNAPGPYTRANPFRTSELVRVDASKQAEATISTPTQTQRSDSEGRRYLQELGDKSDGMLQAFVTSLNATHAPIIVPASDADELDWPRLAHDAAPGTQMVVLTRGSLARITSTLAPKWTLVQTREVPIVTHRSATDLKLQVQLASAWRRAP